jgi:hypothetical protein
MRIPFLSHMWYLPEYFTLFHLSIIIILGKEYKLYNFLPPTLISLLFFTAICSQTPSFYKLLPLMPETKSHTYTELKATLW